jgi:hypothetical protein
VPPRPSPGAAYTGAAAGSVRFALVPVSPTTRARGLRVFAKDAADALVAVVDSGGPRLIERRRLLSGHAGGVRWALQEERRSGLDLTVIDLGRETVTDCAATGCATGRAADASPRQRPSCAAVRAQGHATGRARRSARRPAVRVARVTGPRAADPVTDLTQR